MNRVKAREHVFRILFRYDFHNREEFNKQVELYFETGCEDEVFKTELSELDRAELTTRINNTLDHIEEIDDKISGSCEGWKIERIGKAELTIIRLAATEIFYDDSIDTAIAINEAVELSKKYCDDKSHSFVNGVLARMIK